MSTAKPICVIYYFPEALLESGNPITVTAMNETMSGLFPDYHVFCIPSNASLDGSCEDVRFQVFNDNDLTEIKYNELKELITSQFHNSQL